MAKHCPHPATTAFWKDGSGGQPANVCCFCGTVKERSLQIQPPHGKHAKEYELHRDMIYEECPSLDAVEIPLFMAYGTAGALVG